MTPTMTTTSLSVLAALLLAGVAAARVAPRSGIAHLIVGGNDVADGELPYLVSVRAKTQHTSGQHVCGGVIVAADTVLTSARCIKRFRRNSLYIVAGTRHLYTSGDKSQNWVSIDVEKTHVHEEYSGKQKNHDIAALKLASPLPSDNPNIRAIALLDSSLQDDTECRISGWGSISSGSAMPAPLVKAAFVKLISRESCLKTKHGNTVREDEVCAAGIRKDACMGDEGGPLVCNDKLAGLMSWGRTCASPDYPHVYASVQFYQQWIQDKINDQKPVDPVDPVNPVEPSRAKPVFEVYVKVLGIELHYHTQSLMTPSALGMLNEETEETEDKDSPVFHILIRYKTHAFEYKTKMQWPRHLLAMSKPLSIEF